MTTNDPFTPHADSIQTAWVLMCQQSRISTQPPVEELEAEFDRFLARVRRDAEAELDSWMARAYEAEKRAWQAEKRIKAVEDVLDAAEASINHHPAYTFSGQRMDSFVDGADIRRALEG